MPYITKFDGNTVNRMIALVESGHNFTEVCSLLGFSRVALYRFLNKHPKLKEKMMTIRQDYMAGKIHKNMERIAEGVEVVETIREYLEDGKDGKVIKVTEKVRTIPPCLKANQQLAKKYDIDLTDGKVTDNTNDAKHLSININNSGMTLRELQASKVIEVPDNKLVPPRKDSDDDV